MNLYDISDEPDFEDMLNGARLFLAVMGLCQIVVAVVMAFLLIAWAI